MYPGYIGSQTYFRDVNPVSVVSNFLQACFGRLCIGALLGYVFYNPAIASEDLSPKQWLGKMSDAMQALNYRGVFIYRRGEDLATMKVTHLADQKGSHELLETLTGESRRELRNVPNFSAVDGEASDQLSRIDAFYTLELMGSDRAAGRATRLVSVTPKDEFRYGYRLWLDQDTGLLLKSDLLNQEGETLEQVLFTSLELIPPQQRDSLLKTESMNAAEEQVAVNHHDKIHWAVGALPKGFVLLNAHSNTAQGGFDHMVYSDGLASVSVFVEKTQSDAESFIGLSSMGAVSAFGAVESGHQVTVVGDVPEITVRTIGESITLQESAGD